MKRQVFHKADSILNVMLLSLSSEDSFEPHRNVGRDEVVVVTNGRLELLFDYGKSIILDANTPQCWSLIPKDTTHKFNLLSETAEVLEVIGGIFTSNATMYTNLLS